MLKTVTLQKSRKGDNVFGGRPFARLAIQHRDYGGKEELTQYSTDGSELLAKLAELEQGGKTDPQDIAFARAEIKVHFGIL